MATPSSTLLPVRRDGVPMMLKLALAEEERRGGNLMAWWNGDGAAQVIAHDENALLLERASGPVSLAEMARSGKDDEASHIICAVAARLHAPRPQPLPELVPLSERFEALAPAAAAHGGILCASADAARQLLEAPRDITVLHGDLHHGNVLDFGPRGFLAIDPKGLIGERGFDFANIFCNPDHAAAVAPGRFARRLGVVAEAASLDPSRLLRWILAYAGLSAAWSIADGDDPATALAVAEIAAAETQ
jgi:streptomycin 6-kinase